MEKTIQKQEFDHQQQPKQQLSPLKRRGRPQKKSLQKKQKLTEGQEFFSIHDNVFHAAILFYTFRIFDKAPTRSKFNPTIGFSIYQKAKIPAQQRKYYNEDSVAIIKSQPWSQNYRLKRFFINSLTFGPKCVIDEFYRLFYFILINQPSVSQVLQFMCNQQFKYVMFRNPVLQCLDARTPQIKLYLLQVIDSQLNKLIDILLHTLLCLKNGQKENKYTYILQTQQDLFERGVNSKPKKKVNI